MPLNWWWLRLWGTAEIFCPSFYKQEKWSVACKRHLHLKLPEQKVCICFCLGISLCLQNAGCLWVQACCLERGAQHGSKNFMHRFWSEGASDGHSLTQGTCGRPGNTTQSGISVILHRIQNLTQIWMKIIMWCQQRRLGCVSSEAFIKSTVSPLNSLLAQNNNFLFLLGVSLH